MPAILFHGTKVRLRTTEGESIVALASNHSPGYACWFSRLDETGNPERSRSDTYNKAFYLVADEFTIVEVVSVDGARQAPPK